MTKFFFRRFWSLNFLFSGLLIIYVSWEDIITLWILLMECWNNSTHLTQLHQCSNIPFIKVCAIRGSYCRHFTQVKHRWYVDKMWEICVQRSSRWCWAAKKVGGFGSWSPPPATRYAQLYEEVDRLRGENDKILAKAHDIRTQLDQGRLSYNDKLMTSLRVVRCRTTFLKKALKLGKVSASSARGSSMISRKDFADIVWPCASFLVTWRGGWIKRLANSVGLWELRGHCGPLERSWSFSSGDF